MTIADIKKSINSTHLSDLIPIKELNGEVKDNYQLSYCTYEQIIKEYPFLKDEPLYASPNGSNPCFIMMKSIYSQYHYIQQRKR